ncbi:putative chaperone/heat shock protein Hsp12 [Aaosphaeria arxii CBS 175.79]|uniref:Putative chaperone/heat shock protein Hsp12 n=1 Tax=Aaosphaeria arxii CBS 175.79 TaxID=1450172 RepID=A0A6A5XYS7_9PLEO|nr:putative chaperone/heat shock protein Hsp12 [Aaosphaeria arxii CBS 175.79]KAF2018458.1 putative chaperone/heat shock protein Hsp12 [Aaosphaeria arxii CBS 175.79]
MSDAGRKDFSTKLSEGITPDSTKSTQQKLKETVTDAGDTTARGLQPDHDKSTGQEISDKFGRSKDREVHGSSGGSIVDKTKNALGLGDKH